MTGEEELKKIDSPPEAVSLVEKILQYRQVAKYASTWGLGWFEKPKKSPQGKKFDKSHQFVVNGRVYTSYNQVVKIGRMSSAQPNFQNIPPDLRENFIASPGRKLLLADLKQIELVTAAVVCKEEKLLEALRRGDDVHALTARGILESDPSREGRPVTDEEVQAFRPKAKMVSFGILFGITAKGLAWRIESKFEVPTSIADAQAMIDRFLDTYPALKRWYLEERRKADRGDDITYTLIGRRRLLDISKGYFGGWRTKPSLRLNTPIQGSAGDGFKYAAALLWERRRECPGNPKAVNLVHDEVVLEIDSEHVEAGKEWVEKNMLEGMREVLSSEAPVSVEITVADNWAEKQ
jgi:DNA polymerase-1